ncbi:Actin cytoskeleton-regulatory complex protein PAN1 [Bienertia sinuspersici]
MAKNENPSLLPEIGPDGLYREAPVIAYTEKIIEQEKLQLKKYIEENYSKIRDVEREFANLSLELKLSSGSKNAAFEHMRKKIELQNEKIKEAKAKEEEAKKVWEAALKVVQDEEAVKQKLCEDLNQLVQQSSNSQYARLEELKRRLEALNPGRASTSIVPTSTPVSASPASSTPEVNGAASTAPNQGNGESTPAVSTQNQPPAADGEGRGKKKILLHGKGRGVGALPKGRGTSTSGWTGAGFDVDTGS